MGDLPMSERAHLTPNIPYYRRLKYLARYKIEDTYRTPTGVSLSKAAHDILNAARASHRSASAIVEALILIWGPNQELTLYTPEQVTAMITLWKAQPQP